MKPHAPLFEFSVNIAEHASAPTPHRLALPWKPHETLEQLLQALRSRRIRRVALSGRGPTEAYAQIGTALLSEGFELILVTEAAPDGPSAVRTILDLRAAGATLTDVGQCSALLGTHRLRSALILIGDPGSVEALVGSVRADR